MPDRGSFVGDEAERAGELARGLMDCTLPKVRWTHHAHLVATLWLVRHRPEGLETDLPAFIRRYNLSVGGVNDDHNGYHETITQAYLTAIRAFDAALAPATPVHEACQALLATPLADKSWPLLYWSRSRLFSVEARRGWVEPDLRLLPLAPETALACPPSQEIS